MFFYFGNTENSLKSKKKQNKNSNSPLAFNCIQSSLSKSVKTRHTKFDKLDINDIKGPF